MPQGYSIGVFLFLLLVLLVQLPTGFRLVLFALAQLWKAVRILLFVSLLFAVLNIPEAYYTLGFTPISLILRMPCYWALAPGAPVPLRQGDYKPGAAHLPVPEEYYDRGWWRRQPTRERFKGRKGGHNADDSKLGHRFAEGGKSGAGCRGLDSDRW